MRDLLFGMDDAAPTKRREREDVGVQRREKMGRVDQHMEETRSYTALIQNSMELLKDGRVGPR